MISIIILMIGLIYLASEKTIPISSEQVTLQEVYELDDGRIFYKLEIEGADELTYLAEGTGVSSSEELEKNTQESYYFVTLKNTVWNAIFHSPKDSRRTEWGIIDLKQELRDGYFIETYGKVLTRDVKKAYYEGKDENDRILIWEEGMKIPPAPENIEGLFK